MIENFYNSQEDRLIFPVSTPTYYNTSYNSIYPDCQEDINIAFGLTLQKPPKEIHLLSKKEKHQVIDRIKKFSRYPQGVMPGEGIKSFATEFELVLNEFKKTKCWIFTDAQGNEYGVLPPKGFFGVLGVIAMPWHLMYIDYDAQRWTDIPHIAKILMKYDGQMAMGITSRISEDGRHIDVNEGRHGAMTIALTGAPYCWGRAIVTNNRGRNFDIFELLNIIPKPTELYDEFRIKACRAELYKKSGAEIKQDVGGRIEDQHAYDLSELNRNHDVTFVPSAKKKSGKKILKQGDAFRVDKFYDFFQEPKYSIKQDGVVTDTYLSDAYLILRDVFYNGYVPHEPAWAIIELFRQTAEQQKDQKLSTVMRSKMRKVINTVLTEKYHISKYDDGHKQSEAFYKDFSKVRKSIPDTEKFAGYIAGNNFVEYFMATALYSMIQECDLVKQPDKALFPMPKAYWNETGIEIRSNTGELFSFSKYLPDNKTNPIDGFEDIEDDVETF